MNVEEPFWKGILGRWMWVMTSSALALILTLASLFGVPIPLWVGLLVIVFGIIAALVLAVKDEHAKRLKLAERLRPKLRIFSVPEKSGNRWRIRVCNCSETTVQFSATLSDIDPDIGYQIPAFLQITGSPPPYRESTIPGGEEALIDILIEDFFETPSIGLLLAEHPPKAVPIPLGRYQILVCAFVLQDGGNPARHKFHVIPGIDGKLIVSDAGAPSTSTK